ncbi:hypothetical protein V1511DRAFT_457907 [Dipodascopsis uninucleata]
MKSEVLRKPAKEKLDFKSLEAFPSLGGATNTKASTSSVWGGSSKSTVSAANPSGSATTLGKLNGASRQPHARSGEITDIFTLEIPSQQRSRLVFVEAVTRARESSGVSSIESSTSGLSGATTFIVKGKPEKVALARRELVRSLTPRVKDTLIVPASVRSFIIGTKGRTLKSIIDKSQTKIQIAKKEEQENGETEKVNDDYVAEDETAEVLIEGDIEGVAIAKQEIMAIVAERTKNLTLRLNTIDPDYLPFVSAQISALEEGKDIRIKVPNFYREQTSDIQPSGIVISGERNAVLETKTKIEEFADELRLSYGTASTIIPKRQHRYVVGEKGKASQEIFEATGCIVKVPPVNDTSESVTFIGPRAKLGEAIGLALAKANSIVVDSLDVSKSHGKNRSHAGDLTRYFLVTKKLQAIEKESDVQIFVPQSRDIFDVNSADLVYDIAGKSNESVKKARKEIIDLVNGIPPVRVFHLSGIDPLIHRHIIGFKGRNIQKVKEQFGVETIIPDETDGSTDIILVYDGKSDDDFAPDESEIKASLKAAIDVYEDIKDKQAELVTKILKIPVNEHKYIIGPKRSTINSIIGTPDSPIYVQVGLSKDRPNDGLTEDSVVVRGPAEEVERVTKSITEIVKEASNQEILNSFTVNFQFPMKFSAQLIGKGGANISKLREELGVKIDLEDDGTLTIKGIKSNVLETEKRIKALAKRLEDETIIRITVPNDYHAALIGQKGKFVRRLEERYEVRVLFPRNNGSEEEDAEQPEYMPRTKDEVVIRGPSKGAAKARDELTELYKYEAEHGYSISIDVPRKALSRLIGRNGEYINEIMDNTGAKVDVSRDNTETENVSVVLTGTEDSVAKAKAKITAIVEEVEQFTSQAIDVDKKYHKSLIGNKGFALREIMNIAGAGDQSGSQRRMIRIPPPESSDSKIIVQGKKDVVAKIIKEIERRVDVLSRRVEEKVEVPLDKHRYVIGPSGNTKRSIEKEFGVVLTVPPQNTTTEIKIEGAQEDIEKAKAKIAEVTISQKERNNNQKRASKPLAT